MTCLVIGGGGFIGQWLTRHLLDRGRSVVVLGRRSQRPEGLDARASYRAGDYGDRVLIDSALDEVDEVVDLAYSTVPKSSFEDPVYDISTNLPQCVGLMQAAAARPHIRRLVLVSSGGTVYGHAESTPLREDHATNPVSPYGITKLAIEKYALMFHRLQALPVVIARPANAYGEGQLPYRGQGFIATAGASMREGRPLTVFGGAQVVRDYVHVEDVVSGITAVLDAGRTGACYNIGSGVGHSTQAVLSMLSALAQAAGVTPIVEHRPARPFDVLVNVLDSTRLQADTGWQPRVALDAGVVRTWRWLSDLGSLHGQA